MRENVEPKKIQFVILFSSFEIVKRKNKRRIKCNAAKDYGDCTSAH